MNSNTATTSSSPSGPASTFAAFYAAVRQAPIYVILGVQGSGTNLLRSVLDSAFNFAVVQDKSLVYNAALKVGSNPSPEAVRRQFDAIVARLFPSAITRKTSRRIKANVSYDGIEEAFAQAAIRSGSDLAHFVYAYGAFSRGSTLMAIKSDDLWETISGIDTVLPNRRIVLLTRDFRDNLLSITNKNFGPKEPLVAARYVKDRFAFYDAEYRRMPPERRFHVRYEDLLESPDLFVTRFRQHFGLGDHGWTPPPVNRSRIKSDNTRKWGSLTARQLAQCEAILRDELHAYGYGTESEASDPPGLATWLVARGRDTVRRVPQKVGAVVARLRK
jgi:hypothetical protein